MKPTAHLDKWEVVRSGSSYLAPERVLATIRGYVQDHPEFPDGSHVRTGPILAASGRFVESERTRYKLGRIHPKYRAYLKETGISYDPRNPIKVKS